jgi:hypothetical protein
MHGYLENELTHLRMEIDQDTEMADDESYVGTVIGVLRTYIRNTQNDPT